MPKKIEKLLAEGKIQNPSKNGAFGNVVFSHELVHVIGGHSDSNNNMTQRLLLLLESQSIFNPLIRRQVIKAILERYFEEDTHFRLKNVETKYVPRFLINDIVRFWRTMCVDYASKHRAESGHKWAMRNVKLRFSRKLLFTAGLLLAFECHLSPPSHSPKKKIKGKIYEPNVQLFINHLIEKLDLAPLENLAYAAEKYSKKKSTSLLLFNSYDAFLKKIDVEGIRGKLETMNYDMLRNDHDFNELRDLSHDFQKGLNQLFFKDNKKLAVLSQSYGVF